MSVPKTADAHSAVLRATNIMKRFGALRVLTGVSLDVRQGEIHALIGPNGAGKSTFFKIISGELNADEGSVEAFGEEVTHARPHELARLGIGRAFQIPNVFADMTALEALVISVEAASRWGTLLRTQRRWVTRPEPGSLDKAHEILELFGVVRLAQRRVGELSHGDYKLVELAMAAAQEPSILLLDEPMAGMSPREVERCGDVIENLIEQRGVSALLTEHDMDAVFRLASRVSVLSGGILIASGPPDEVRRDSKVREAYLGAGQK